jgi:hypothetical protein
MLRLARLWAVVGFLVCAGTLAKAAPLNLTPQPPDITSGLIGVSYDATTDVFLASGMTLSLDLDGAAPPEFLGPLGGVGSYSISAVIDSTGTASGGTLSVLGANPLGVPSGVLLTGPLSQVGFDFAASNKFEFIFSVTGGDLAALFGPKAGVILIAGASTPAAASFGADFTTFYAPTVPMGPGTADTFAIPLPGAAWMGGGLLVALSALRFVRRAGQQAN